MNKKEIIDSINILRKYNSETDKIECKRALYGFPKKCYDSISSFSNKHGGIIIFGLNEEENFKTEGVYDANDLQKKITSLCSDSMEPIIRPEILSLKFEEKTIVAVKIDELSQNMKPCYYKPSGMNKGSYTRIGDRDDRMTDYELYSLQSYNNHIFEDTRININATLKDLNVEDIKTYIAKLKEKNLKFSKIDFETCLRLCGILSYTNNKIHPTLAGILIFSDYPQCFYPQLFVACALIPGFELSETNEYGERFLDNLRVEGTLEEMINQTMTFLMRNMKKE